MNIVLKYRTVNSIQESVTRIVTTMPEPTRGERFYLVRLACGDGVRKPLSLKSFVARIKAETGIVLHPSELSEIENDKPSKAVTTEHIDAVAAVDPLERGKLWLGWGEQNPPAATHSAGGLDLDPTKDYKLSAAEIRHAVRQAKIAAEARAVAEAERAAGEARKKGRQA